MQYNIQTNPLPYAATERRLCRVALPLSTQGENDAAPEGRLKLGVDAHLRKLCDRGDYQAAVRCMLLDYGSDIRAFLRARTRDADMAAEVYAMFSEDLWKGLPGFRFQGKARSWLFTIARHALARHMSAHARWNSRHRPLLLEETCRHSDTGSHNAAVRHRLRHTLRTLSPAEHLLVRKRMILSMDWKEIAREQLGDAEGATSEVLDRESARLRKRYQLLVRRVRQALREDADFEWP